MAYLMEPAEGNRESLTSHQFTGLFKYGFCFIMFQKALGMASSPKSLWGLLSYWAVVALRI
jgi:hypothetical protein